MLQVENVLWVLEGLRSRTMQYFSEIDRCYWMLSWPSQVLGTFFAGDMCMRDVFRVWEDID